MSDMTVPIRGSVARVLTARELALNIGARQGVKVGMLFDVLDPRGEDIRDPMTGESLGSLRRIKVRVRVREVQDRLSAATTFRSTTRNIGGNMLSFSDFSKSLLPSQWVEQQETLKKADKPFEDFDEGDSYVKAGDPVEQVFEKE